MDRRKKILFLITKSNWGGAQRYVYDLAAHLPRERFDVAVAAGGGDGMLFDMLGRAGVRTIPIPALGRDIRIRNEWAAFWQILGIIKKERPDAVHLNSSKAGALGAIAGRIGSLFLRKRIQIIFTAHGWAFHEDRTLPIRGAIKVISWFASLFQDTIILINHPDYDAAKRFIPDRKLKLIPNIMADVHFMIRGEARIFFAKRLGVEELPGHTFIIGTIAELTKNKGLEYLIQAVDLLRTNSKIKETLRVIIIGDGGNREPLERMIRDRRLEHILSLVGFIPTAARYLYAFDVFVLPSQKEGLPYALIEAMSARLPIIATNVGGIPDLIKENETGLLIPPKDSQKLSKALEHLILRPEERIRLGENAAALIETKFRFSDMLEHTTLLYDSETHQ